MQKFRIASLGLVTAVCLTAGAQAEFMFDVHRSGTSGGVPVSDTQAGWTAFGVGYGGEASASVTESGVTFTLAPASGTVAGREERGEVTGSGLDDMWEDLAFAKTGDVLLNLTIGGLAAGGYDITLYTHDAKADGNPLGGFTADVFVDGVDVADIEMTNGKVSSSMGQQTVNFTSDGVNDVVIGLQAQADDVSEGRAILSGFQVVPEPTSLALVGLGGLLMISRRKRA
jgi:hypothetical protein